MGFRDGTGRAQASFRAAPARATIACVRWLLVLALFLAGCGAAKREAPALRKVDDVPLYELVDTLPTPSVYASLAGRGWACTMFFGAGGEPIMGRNFDSQ